jgi:hypothetical protein
VNLFSYQLKNAMDGQEGVFLVEFGDEPLASKGGRIMALNGIYRFVLREVSPLRDASLHKILISNYFERAKPWFPTNASVLVMVPFMHEESEPQYNWFSVGKPLDPLESYSVEDVDAWILQAVARDGIFRVKSPSKHTSDSKMEQDSSTMSKVTVAKTVHNKGQ